MLGVGGLAAVACHEFGLPPSSQAVSSRSWCVVWEAEDDRPTTGLVHRITIASRPDGWSIVADATRAS
eukprot:1743940-Pyramimonas_sp.AAC.1